MSRGDRRSLRGGTRTRAPTATRHGSAAQRLCLLIQQVEFTSALARVVERDSNLRAFPLGNLPPGSIRHKNRLSRHFRPPVKREQSGEANRDCMTNANGDERKLALAASISLAVETNAARKSACLCLPDLQQDGHVCSRDTQGLFHVPMCVGHLDGISRQELAARALSLAAAWWGRPRPLTRT